MTQLKLRMCMHLRHKRSLNGSQAQQLSSWYRIYQIKQPWQRQPGSKSAGVAAFRSSRSSQVSLHAASPAHTFAYPVKLGRQGRVRRVKSAGSRPGFQPGVDFGVLTETEVFSRCGYTVRSFFSSLWRPFFSCRPCSELRRDGWLRIRAAWKGLSRKTLKRVFKRHLQVGKVPILTFNYYFMCHDVSLEKTSASR